MESWQHTGKRKPIGVPCLVFLLALLKLCDAADGQNDFNHTVSCSENEYEHNGFCCDKCPPGFKLTEKCLGSGLRSKCMKCSNGTFQDNTNHYPNCFSCRELCDSKSKEFEIAACTHKQDRKCGCQSEYFQNILNEITMSCVPCRKCGNGERETSPCGGQMNRVCECKHNHYRVDKGNCAECTNCTSKCSGHCPTDKTTKPNPHPTGSPFQTTLVWVAPCVVMVLLCIISLLVGFKHWKRRKPSASSIPPVSCDPEKHVEKIDTHTCLQNKDERSLLAVQLDSVLPDCIPREIKTHEFIYLVLDIVPVSRFKELVRRLNVSEQDISRAEKDNRAFADAQYQMLIIWADRGISGRRNILPRPLFQEFVHKLKVMNLTACAESIEEKYNCTKPHALLLQGNTFSSCN